jgi:hypothetical protein
MVTKYPLKKGLIGLEVAADYLNCSHQYLSKILKDADNPDKKLLREYFRFYAGRWRTTYALLDEYFTSPTLVKGKKIASQKEVPDAHEESVE